MALTSIRTCFFALQNGVGGYPKYVVCSNLKRLSTSTKSLPFVPRSEEPSTDDVTHLAAFISKSKKLFVLTGAGLSTESGIPDYRSEGVGRYSTSNQRPVQYSDFLKSSEVRQRYWARNYVGWSSFSSFQPNEAHRILSDWERTGRIHWLVTQNVDTLHNKAGSKRVTELHGSAHRVICLSCQQKIERNLMQELIQALNPEWHAQSIEIAPDGDVTLTGEQIQGFKVPPCQNCGGILKPEIVFFGDNVAKPIVNFVFDQMAECDAMLVAGSSLEVYSGFRFINRANELKIPITIINIGKTRGDKLAHLKISARCGHVLQQVHDVLTTATPSS